MVEDRKDFAPLIEQVSSFNKQHAEKILSTLTDFMPNDAHFWNHRGRFHIYRLKDDDITKAVGYLRKAISLAPDDALHHHTFGLVKRAEIRQQIRAYRSNSTADFLELISGTYEEASRAFTKARLLKPDQTHGYITHTQMILEVADKLKRIARSSSVATLSSGALGWIQEEVTLAYELLEDVDVLYSSLSGQNVYVTKCRAMMSSLHGDLDEVIRLWEISNASGSAGAFGRRALALAYLERNKGKWSTLKDAELRRIYSHAVDNLNGSASRDLDYVLWFETFSRLPEFDISDAIMMLASWGAKSASWRPWYYLYVMQFLRWFTGQTDSTEFEESLKKCSALFVGRRNQSFLWLAYSENQCPVVSSDELGGWDRRQNKNFWREPDKLGRVCGHVDETPLKPQSGRIVIDRSVTAFFVPGKEFASHEHENDPVNFFLGFGIDGLRAWKQELGDNEGMKRVAAGAADKTISLYLPPSEEFTAEQQRVAASSIQTESVCSYINEFVEAMHQRELPAKIEEMLQSAQAIFGFSGSFEENFGCSIESLFLDRSDVELTVGPSGEKTVQKRILDRSSDDVRKMGKLLWV